MSNWDIWYSQPFSSTAYKACECFSARCNVTVAVRSVKAYVSPIQFMVLVVDKMWLGCDRML